MLCPYIYSYMYIHAYIYIYIYILGQHYGSTSLRVRPVAHIYVYMYIYTIIYLGTSVFAVLLVVVSTEGKQKAPQATQTLTNPEVHLRKWSKIIISRSLAGDE